MRLTTFGGLTITNGAEPAGEPRLQRRQLALLAVLAAEGAGGVTRDRLLFLFWPDREADKARHALDQVLYVARRELGAEALVQGPTTLQLNASVLPSDVADFSAALSRGDLDAAVAAYAGPFLDGVHIPDAGEFERWAEGHRTQFANAFVQALTRLAKQASAGGEYALAVQHLRRAAASAPLDGTVARALVLALAYSGNPSAALEVARAHVALVRQELGSAPDSALRDLIAMLQSPTAMVPPVPARTSAAIRVAPRVDEPAPAELVATNAPLADESPSRAGRLGMFTLAVATVVLLGVLVARMEGTAGRHPVMLRDRQQVTTTGGIAQPALSRDGAYLAYVTTRCGSAGCTSDVNIQEVGTRATRSVVEGVSLVEYIGWSPDRRNLMIAGTLVNGVNGLYLVSILGGTPRHISGFYFPAFFAGGDSLLLVPSAGSDSVYWARVAALDGVPRDSIAVPGPGVGIQYAMNVPGTSWFILQVVQKQGAELRVIDRAGRETDRRVFSSIGLIQVSRDALWFSRDFNLMRVPFDTVTGRFGTTTDTVYVGLFSGFDVTTDGSRLMLDEGTEDYDVWALTLDDALRGKFSPDRRLVHGTARFAVTISPDGKRVLLARETGIAEAVHFRLTTMPFDGGAETPLPTRGEPGGWTWIDSTTIAINEFESGRAHAVLIDVRTGARLAEFTPPDSSMACCPVVSPNGVWAWVPGDEQSIRVQGRGEALPRTFPAPAWFQGIWYVGLSPDGSKVLYMGKSVLTDSLRVNVLSLTDSSTTTWWTTAGVPEIDASWLQDGTMLLGVHKTTDTRTFYRLRAPGRADSLGTIPRAVWGVDVTPDMKRAVISTREHNGDAWMYRVERR